MVWLGLPFPFKQRERGARIVSWRIRLLTWLAPGKGESMFDRGRTNHAPLLSHEFAPGEPTGASTGMSHPGSNFEIGLQRSILFNPYFKSDEKRPGPQSWAVARTIALIALLTAAPASTHPVEGRA